MERKVRTELTWIPELRAYEYAPITSPSSFVKGDGVLMAKPIPFDSRMEKTDLYVAKRKYGVSTLAKDIPFGWQIHTPCSNRSLDNDLLWKHRGIL